MHRERFQRKRNVLFALVPVQRSKDFGFALHDFIFKELIDSFFEVRRLDKCFHVDHWVQYLREMLSLVQQILLFLALGYGWKMLLEDIQSKIAVNND